MAVQQDFATLVSEIRKRLAGRDKGTMFLKTGDGHSFAVAFQGGAITGVSAGLIVGNEAVDKLRAVDYASFRVSPSPFTPPGSMPDPFHVSQLLGSDGVMPSRTVDMPAPGQGQGFHQRALSVVESNLVEVLGPFATFVLADARKSMPREYSSVDDLQHLLSTLAKEIGDRERADWFVQTTIAALKS